VRVLCLRWLGCILSLVLRCWELAGCPPNSGLPHTRCMLPGLLLGWLVPAKLCRFR
jgi:hypothetical protein